MTKCAVHNDFFDDECIECKKEYNEKLKDDADSNYLHGEPEETERLESPWWKNR